MELLDTLPVALVVTTREGRIERLNAAAERLLGYMSAEAIGRPLALLVAPDWSSEVRTLHERALAGETVEQFATHCIVKGGRQLRVRISLAPRLDSGGVPGGVALVVTPAEPPRAAQRRQGGSGDRLRLEIGSVRIGTWQWRLGTDQMACSATLEELHGLPPGSFGGSIAAFEQLVHPDDRAPLLGDMQRAAREKVGFLREYRFVRPDGSVGWIEASGRILLDAQGNPERMSTVCVDITGQKHAEIALQRTRGEVKRLGSEVERRLEEAERANRAKDQVLAVVAHELRAPLAPALSAVDLVSADTRLPQELREGVATIERSLLLAARLVDDLLDLSRISRHKVELRVERIDIADVVDDALALCAAELSRSGLGVALNGASRVAWVHGDATRLSQVLWNLLTNAIKFTPQGGSISIAWRRVDNRVELEVADTGSGIDNRLLPRVFEPFEQGTGEMHAAAVGGLGLGLAISRALVEMHGGTIEAQSEGPDRGATFRITLPRAPSPTSETAARRTAPLSVLVVEDHRDLARMLGELLGLLGHRAVTASSVDEAIAHCEQQRFDIVLSDIELGPKLGYELLRYLRDKGIDTPAIALSGHSSNEAIERSLEAGFIDHLVKPVGARALLDAVGRVADTKADPDRNYRK